MLTFRRRGVVAAEQQHERGAGLEGRERADDHHRDVVVARGLAIVGANTNVEPKRAERRCHRRGRDQPHAPDDVRTSNVAASRRMLSGSGAKHKGAWPTPSVW